jgi:hypothetical protein
MRLTLSTVDGTSNVSFEISHEYGGEAQRLLWLLVENRDNIYATIYILKNCVVPVSTDPGRSVTNTNVIAYWEKELQNIKNDISLIRQRPIKTHAILRFADGCELRAFSKISEDDAAKGLHSRAIGKRTAIYKLLDELKNCICLDKAGRRELAKQIVRYLPKKKK